MFAIGIFLLVVALVAFGIAALIRPAPVEPAQDPVTGKPRARRSDQRRTIRIIGTGMAAAAVLALALASFYTQDPGEANVLKDVTGNIVGQNNDTGLQLKAPWVNTVTFNIRNQQVVFAGPAGQQSDHNGGTANGPEITAQDKDGVSSNIDIALRYSIRPDAVTDIYRKFLSEENFKKSFIEQDIRSVVRQVPNSFPTLDLITQRGDVEASILKALEARWESEGVTVDSISLQEIRPPASVVASYAAAQEAQINVTKEEANLSAEQVKAQQKVVNAKAESDANALLNASLSPQILQQRYLDTLKELAAAGNLVVVPEGFNGLVNVTK